MSYSKMILVGPCKISKISKFSFTKKSFFIFIDGGLKHIKKFPSKNWISIGDQDSSKNKLDIKLTKEKDASDLHFALKLIPKNIKWLEVYGLFPNLKDELRFDHRLCNLGELYHHSKKQKAYFKLNESQIILPAGKHVLNIRSLFSILTFETTLLQITGKAMYPLLRPTPVKVLSSLTLSNKATGEISIQNNKPILITAKNKFTIRSKYSPKPTK